jgi:hypothetical protein
MENKIDELLKSAKMMYSIIALLITCLIMGVGFAVKVLTHSEIVDNRLNSTKEKVVDLQKRVMELEKEVAYQKGLGQICRNGREKN